MVRPASSRQLLGHWTLPHPNGRWFVVTTTKACKATTFTIYDAQRDVLTTLPANGNAFMWLRNEARFTTSDENGFWIYDAPSATYQRIWVPDAMRAQLDQFEPEADRPAWNNGRLAELADGLASHIQCLAKSCVEDTAVIGWFYVGADNVIDASRPVPRALWPVEAFCGL